MPTSRAGKCLQRAGPAMCPPPSAVKANSNACVGAVQYPQGRHPKHAWQHGQDEHLNPAGVDTWARRAWTACRGTKACKKGGQDIWRTLQDL